MIVNALNMNPSVVIANMTCPNGLLSQLHSSNWTRVSLVWLHKKVFFLFFAVSQSEVKFISWLFSIVHKKCRKEMEEKLLCYFLVM